MLKRFLSLALVCALLLPCLALAQTATLTTLDLGDLSIDIDPNTPGQLGQKAEGTPLLQMFPAYLALGDETTNMIIQWTGEQMDIGTMTGVNLSLYATEVLEGFKEGFESSGLTIVDASLLSLDHVDVGGKQALSFDLFATVDYSSLGAEYAGMQLDFYQRSYVVPVSDGAYAFVAVTLDQSVLDAYISPIMATVHWN